ncbi:transposase family protein [Streptomyces sp. NPDC008001]|uniref:transposase family protein n=1 Tax=Streptomyces sp. NPDC008001 TaxID=3364804 RepID=UPI0036EBBF8D
MWWRIDGAETRIRRPEAGRPGRRAFVPGKKKQDTIKTTSISDGQGRLLWSGANCPGRMHDRTAMRTEGIAEQFRLHPKVTTEVGKGCRGWPTSSPTRSAPLRRSRRATRRSAAMRLAGDAPTAVLGADLRRARQRRIAAVVPAPAPHRLTRGLRRNHQAIASLVSDRSARRPTRRKPNTELVPARQAACWSTTSRPARPARPSPNRGRSRKAYLVSDQGPGRIAHSPWSSSRHTTEGISVAVLRSR